MKMVCAGGAILIVCVWLVGVTSSILHPNKNQVSRLTGTVEFDVHVAADVAARLVDVGHLAENLEARVVLKILVAVSKIP